MMVRVSLEAEGYPVVKRVYRSVPGAYLQDGFFYVVLSVNQTVMLDVLDWLHKEHREHSDTQEERSLSQGLQGILAVLFKGEMIESEEVGPVQG